MKYVSPSPAIVYHDEPVAILLYRDGRQELHKLPDISYPPRLYQALPARHDFTGEAPADRCTPPQRRVFTRSSFAAALHRNWWVYNDGRSRTPIAVPIYLEDET